MQSVLYARRRPEKSVLYQVVRENIETFFARTDDPDSGRKPLPKYVKNAFRKYLECGVLQNGFWRIRCPECGFDTVVAFS